MAPRYYAAMARSEDDQLMLTPAGPLSSYSLVVERHAQELDRRGPSHPIRPPKYERRILLDLGSIEMTDEWALQRLLSDDPALRAIFELGRRTGLAPQIEHLGRQAGQ